MATNVTDPYTDLHDDESGKMVLASKSGYWDTVWEILNRKPYLVNCIPEERAWAVLHQAVWWKDAIAVKKILAVPGCDSELLTKNGLRPLDIETTAEIRKLLEQHIAHANGWEETPQGDLEEAKTKETPQADTVETKTKETLPVKHKFSKKAKKANKLISNGSKHSFKKEPPSANNEITNSKIVLPNVIKKTYEELVEESEQHTKVITKEAKSKNWKKLFSLLDKWKNLVNKTDPDTGMAPLHYAAEANDVEAVQKILYYPACDPAVKTAKTSSYGAGKTPVEITTSHVVEAAIRWKERKQLENHNDVPTFVSIHDSNLMLMRYTAKAMEESKGDICDDDLDIDELKIFPEMGSFIYNFINTGNANWKSAREAVAKEIHSFDATKKLKAPTTSEEFFIEVISHYTGSFYSEFNSKLRDQATDQMSKTSEYKVYAALANSLLFGNFLEPNEVWTKKTYRGMDLSNTDISKYTKGKEFAWLSLTSSSGKEGCAFKKNCKFIIDNSQSCEWSPRGISSISQIQSEDEYLYPCGAQFRVTKVEKKVGVTEIYIKLIDTPDPWIVDPIDTKDLENRTEKIKEEFKVLAGVRKELAEIGDKLKGTRQTIQANKDYEKQIIENKIRRFKIRKNEAYYCSICNYTCHYPCPESDTKEEGRCSVSGAVAEGHCEKCPQKCHFNSHKKVNFVNEIKSKCETKVNKKKKARFDSAKEMESETEELLAKEQNHFDATLLDILKKLGQWDVMALRFEKKLNAGQTPAKKDTGNMIRLYTEMKVDVKTIRMGLEEDQLN